MIDRLHTVAGYSNAKIRFRRDCVFRKADHLKVVLIQEAACTGRDSEIADGLIDIAEEDFGVRVSGNSMEPVYHDGQIVWVERCETLSIGQVGVFVYDGEGYLKSYGEREPDESDRDAFTDSYGRLHMQPVLVSYNKDYSDRIISP